MKRTLVTSIMAIALVTGLVGCGESKVAVQGNVTSSTPQVNNTAGNSTNTTSPANTAGNDTGNTTGGNASNLPRDKKGEVVSPPQMSLPPAPPGPNGQAAAKVDLAVFQDPQVYVFMANYDIDHHPDGSSSQWGFNFTSNDSKGNLGPAANGLWTGQLMADGAAVANVTVSASTFKVVSFSPSK